MIPSFRAADDIAAHPPSEKVERWEVLKNTTVARCAARVYCGVALALLLRVQLSVLAGQGGDSVLVLRFNTTPGLQLCCRRSLVFKVL